MYNDDVPPPITNASPSRVCLVLISHLGEQISLRELADEVYNNAPRGRRRMDDRGERRKKMKEAEAQKLYDRANYEEVRQCCKDLKDAGLINKSDPEKREVRESLVSLRLRAFIREVFKAKSVVNKEKMDWESLIAWKAKRLKSAEGLLKEARRLVKAGYHGKFINPETSYEIRKKEIQSLRKELEQLREDAKEARAFGAVSATSLNEREITFLIKRIDINQIKEVCDALRKSGMLDYIREESNIVNLFIALIKGYGNNTDSSGKQHDRMLNLLGLKDIKTEPITDAVISSFVLLSQHPEVIEFHNTYYVNRPRN